MAKAVSKKEPMLQVSIKPSVARDLIRVLSKFSAHQMEGLLYGDTKRADRLLALNLFRAHVEEAMRKNGN